MMISYPSFAKLKTKQIIYQNVILTSDSCTLEQLKELSSTRKAIEDSSHATEAIAREMSGGLTSRCEQYELPHVLEIAQTSPDVKIREDIVKLENYLPLLENFIHHINGKYTNHQMSSWISDLKIRWSSALTSSSIFNLNKGPKLYHVNNIYFELAMTLFLYGALLREHALEVLSSDLKQSATLFRKAAGVYNYLFEVVIKLNGVQERPPEATSGVSSVLSLVFLAEAQAVSARKAEENGNSHGLLAKLHYGVTHFLVEAIEILQVITKECKNISSRLLEFLFACKTLHELKSYKHFVISLKNDCKIGVAIGFLRWALANSKKNAPKEESWRLVYKQVIDELTQLIQKYEHENDFVWHEKVPYTGDLPSPQGEKIVNLIPYQPQKWERPLIFKL